MDEIARRYLLLGLRLDRVVPEFVDSYVGPAELRAEAAQGPAPDPLALADEAEELWASIDAALRAQDPVTVRRRRWFEGQLRSMAAQARAATGDEPPFVELVERLLDIEVVEHPEAELLAARQRLDDALPGAGSLTQRMARFRSTLSVPGDRLVDALRRSAARFQAVSRRDFELPDDEGIDWEEAHDQPWGAYAEFTGHGRTAIRINVDLPREVPVIPFLASHEAYPGHHAEHIVKERTLIDAGFGEALLRTMSTPESVLAEGQADLAREVVMSNHELEDELRRVGRDVGVDGDWAAALEVAITSLDLEAAFSTASLMFHRDGRSDDEIREYLMEISPQPAERIEHMLRILHEPANKTYEFTYVEGARLIRPWLERQGQTAGFARLLSEQLSPAQLRAELA